MAMRHSRTARGLHRWEASGKRQERMSRGLGDPYDDWLSLRWEARVNCEKRDTVCVLKATAMLRSWGRRKGKKTEALNR